MTFLAICVAFVLITILAAAALAAIFLSASILIIGGTLWLILGGIAAVVRAAFED